MRTKSALGSKPPRRFVRRSTRARGSTSVRFSFSARSKKNMRARRCLLSCSWKTTSKRR